MKKIPARYANVIEQLVKHYEERVDLFQIALNSLNGSITISKKLQPYIHSVKFRTKAPSHLKDKLERKYWECVEKKQDFDISKDNLFLKINDLAGFRIIHLHTKQIEQIHPILKEILTEQKWEIIEGPEAKTWDDESVSYFESIGFTTVANKNMYTSIHYVIKPNDNITCELQVRTLVEEVWGEVDHKINYPHKTTSHSCREQIKVLARSTSSCGRLVDCIFSTHDEHGKVANVSLSKNESKKIQKVAKKTDKRTSNKRKKPRPTPYK